MNLREHSQTDELLRQRNICGWNNTPEYIAAWLKSMEAGSNYLFWIKPTSQPDLRAGHISLNSEYDPPFLDVDDKSVLKIATLFILPEYRGGGIARAAVETIEQYAVTEPYGSKHCRAIVINAVSRKYSEEDEWRADYFRMTGFEPKPRGASNEDWYARMGYVTYREEPTYPAHRGPKDRKLWAVFMRKELQS